MDKKEIKKIYNLLNGTYKAVKEMDSHTIESRDIIQFNSLIQELSNITNDGNLLVYEITREDYCHDEYRDCLKSTFLLKILPILEYINNTFIDNADEAIEKVGALYNAIEDLELQKRCGDILLVATGAFDRVINQATQILEDRIKKKANLQNTNLIGLPLVSKSIHSKIEHTILKFSDDNNVQESYAELFKGIIGTYRNSTHHGLEYECTREDALKFCAYIDFLLKELDKSECLVR